VDLGKGRARVALRLSAWCLVLGTEGQVQFCPVRVMASCSGKGAAMEGGDTLSELSPPCGDWGPSTKPSPPLGRKVWVLER
jgi:hypothetical protein